jgi:hypothetical protein
VDTEAVRHSLVMVEAVRRTARSRLSADWFPLQTDGAAMLCAGLGGLAGGPIVGAGRPLRESAAEAPCRSDLPRSDQAALVGKHHELRPVAGVELGHGPTDVCLDRRRTHEELGGDLLVALTGRD